MALICEITKACLIKYWGRTAPKTFHHNATHLLSQLEVNGRRRYYSIIEPTAPLSIFLFNSPLHNLLFVANIHMHISQRAKSHPSNCKIKTLFSLKKPFLQFKAHVVGCSCCFLFETILAAKIKWCQNYQKSSEGWLHLKNGKTHSYKISYRNLINL